MYIREVDDDDMWGEVYQAGFDIVSRFFDKGILFLSFIFGVFLSAIGYPREIILFIVVLTIIDLVTKHLSIVVVNYGSLSFKNYKQGWIDQKLTSRQLKNGLCLKTILYASLLYICNQLCIVDGILFGKEISGILYNAIILVEISSVLENFIDIGCMGLIPIRDYIKNKQKQLFGEKINK